MPAAPRLDIARNRPRPVEIELRVARGSSRALHHEIQPAKAVATSPGDAAGLVSIFIGTCDVRSRATSIAGLSIKR